MLHTERGQSMSLIGHSHLLQQLIVLFWWS